MMNGIFKTGEAIYRIIDEDSDKVFVINCSKQSMPSWENKAIIANATELSEEQLCEKLNAELIPESKLSNKAKGTMHQRYTMIAGILPYIADDSFRNICIRRIAEQNHISKKTVCNYLCSYLTFNNIVALAPKERIIKKVLTQDQKNMRWALNKFYYTRHGNTLADSYVMMLKEKYCDCDGKLFEKYPSLSQFRYYYNKTRSKQTEIISREGMKNYMMNSKPLLGDSIREFAPFVGCGMIDGTICDIYLVDEAGNLVGRPVLLACVDAYSGLCMGYSLLWEGGIYSVKELMLNVITDKVKWCKQFGIEIEDSQWPCHQLPGEIVSDRGSEYISFNFEQITELGITITVLPSFSANLKGQVEKLFDLIQNSYKPYLKGKGVIESDFQNRGAKDYRKTACLTMAQFEKIVLHCIVYHNSQRVIESFPFTKAMLKQKIKPFPADIWTYGCDNNPNLITTTKEQLVLTLLPRTRGKFTRQGLKVNKLRYRADGYTDRFLEGGEAEVSYNPDDISYIFLTKENYSKFELIERRFEGMTLDEANSLLQQQSDHISQFNASKVQAKVELAKHIEATAAQGCYSDNIQLDGIRQTRQKARTARHRDLVYEEVTNA